jgi:hypothetical protein
MGCLDPKEKAPPVATIDLLNNQSWQSIVLRAASLRIGASRDGRMVYPAFDLEFQEYGEPMYN